MTRRRVTALAVIAGVLLVAFALATVVRERQVGGEPNAPVALKDRAEIDVGTAVADHALADYPGYREELAREFSSVTPENAMKWGVLEPERGDQRWDGADALVDFAGERGMLVRGHALVWHNQLPLWVSQGDWEREELRDVLRDHVETVVGRYRGRVGEWDVLNEIVADDGSGLRESVFSDVLGSSFPGDVLRWAREADPDAELWMNEIAADGLGPKSDRYFALARDLLAEGAPLDGVGFQAHLNLDGIPDGFEENLRRFSDLGLAVRITELDVAIPVPASEEDLATQADLYAEVARTCRRVPRCEGITVWGFTDRFSWIPETQPGLGAATLLDEDLDPKPAYHSFADGVSEDG